MPSESKEAYDPSPKTRAPLGAEQGFPSNVEVCRRIRDRAERLRHEAAGVDRLADELSVLSPNSASILLRLLG